MMIIIYIIIGILLASLYPISDAVLKKTSFKILLFVNIILYIVIEIIPFFQVFIFYSIESGMALNRIILGFYSYIFVRSFFK